MSKPGHNSGKGGPIDPAKLKSYVERIEAVEAEEADYKAAKKDIYVEVKAAGMRPKMVRKIVKERKKTEADAEDEAELELYRAALAMPGATYRSVSAKTGIPKSTLQRLVPRNKNGTSAPKPEDGDDGITDAAGRDPGIEGESDDAPDDLRVSEADRSTDGGHGQSASGGQGVQRRAGCLPAGGAGQDVCDPGASVQRDVGERGDHATAGRDAARLTPAMDLAHNEVQPSATPSVGAVASESERVAHHDHDDDLRIPDFLRGSREAGV